MIILSWRNSTITTIIGWEALGLSSVILVIFYPNKWRRYNSVITATFNRIGDIIIIYRLGIIAIIRECRFSSTCYNQIRRTTGLLIGICCLSKRAQYPLSAWLPAAISAPTPISAIVHSSTLVTAGLLVIRKINKEIKESIVNKPIIALSIIRFLIGGILRTIETDYKKKIAYSTMRQIRLIIRLITIGIVIIRLAHTLIHAWNKTILFCSAGLKFMENLGCQKSNKGIKPRKRKEIILLVRLYGISGIIFSRSFYTKHNVLENLYSQREQVWRRVILIRGRLLTMSYIVELRKRTKQIRLIKITINKDAINKTIVTIRLISIISWWLVKNKLPVEREVRIRIIENIGIFLLILIPILVLIKKKVTKRIAELTETTGLTKKIIYRYWKRTLKINKNLIRNDKWLIKPTYLKLSLEKKIR